MSVEVVAFGLEVTQASLEALGASARLRLSPVGVPFVTDGGNFIIDCHFGRLGSPADTERAVNGIVGVVENGLFIGRSSAVVVASADGVEIMTRGDRGMS